MDKLQVTIAGISEMRWSGSGVTTSANGNLILHSGNNEGSRYGVGIFVARRMKETLHSWTPISDRLIKATFRCRARPITIVQCYAPTEDANDDIKDDFYTALTSTLTGIPRGNITVIMGDFNAKIGPNFTRMRSATGGHGIGTRNNNGDRLIEVCQMFQLIIGGSMFPHRDIHKYTWTSPSGNTRNQIDHICISRKWRKSLLDVRNKRGASIDSDHELIIGELSIKLDRNRPRNADDSRNHRPAPLNIHLLGETDISARLASTLRTHLLPQQGQTWEQTCDTLRTAAEGIIGTQQRRRNNWISSATWDTINKRNSLELLADRDSNRRDEHRALCKAVKRADRNDKRALLDRLADNAKRAANENNMRSLYQTIDQISGGYRRKNQPVKDAIGILLTSDDDQIHRWRQHFMEISNSDMPSRSDDYRNVAPANGNRRISSVPPSDDANLAVLHNGKTSAPFQTNTGVKQGCPLSPLLFNIVVDEVMREVCKHKRGITWSFT
ncbi:uncharacterized protein LOC122320089 [Drosophila ficusphila]|uniref:uncharacterized protein LOC122320089 n=1 Tax=Drosophila ficusphila TaxID=30025 RepID=UPI001C893E94|nr:uncharacterized protein LOC122320089 [Drosophila ficusphila]